MVPRLKGYLDSGPYNNENHILWGPLPKIGLGLAIALSRTYEVIVQTSVTWPTIINNIYRVSEGRLQPSLENGVMMDHL